MTGGHGLKGGGQAHEGGSRAFGAAALAPGMQDLRQRQRHILPLSTGGLLWVLSPDAGVYNAYHLVA